MLAKQSQSPSSPSKRALDELIKRCELAIYNAAFTLKELNDLRSESRVQQQKKSRSKRQMAPTRGLEVQEARELIALRNELFNKEESGGEEPPITAPETFVHLKRAPPTCSECNFQGNKSAKCPNSQAT
jgi:hypothetical protein